MSLSFSAPFSPSSPIGGPFAAAVVDSVYKNKTITGLSLTVEASGSIKVSIDAVLTRREVAEMWVSLRGEVEGSLPHAYTTSSSEALSLVEALKEATGPIAA